MAMNDPAVMRVVQAMMGQNDPSQVSFGQLGDMNQGQDAYAREMDPYGGMDPMGVGYEPSQDMMGVLDPSTDSELMDAYGNAGYGSPPMGGQADEYGAGQGLNLAMGAGGTAAGNFATSAEAQAGTGEGDGLMMTQNMMQGRPEQGLRMRQNKPGVQDYAGYLDTQLNPYPMR